MKLFTSKQFSINPENLKHIRTFARDFFNQLQIEKEQTENLVLAIIEAASNIMEHAYENNISTDVLEIVMNILPNQVLEIQILDKGKPIQLDKIKSRNLKDIRAGGLGIYFVGEIMDEVKFLKEENSKWNNRLIISKNITTPLLNQH